MSASLGATNIDTNNDANMWWIRLKWGQINTNGLTTVMGQLADAGKQYHLMPSYEANILVSDGCAVFEVPAGYTEGCGPSTIVTL